MRDSACRLVFPASALDDIRAVAPTRDVCERGFRTGKPGFREDPDSRGLGIVCRSESCQWIVYVALFWVKDFRPGSCVHQKIEGRRCLAGMLLKTVPHADAHGLEVGDHIVQRAIAVYHVRSNV